MRLLGKAVSRSAFLPAACLAVLGAGAVAAEPPALLRLNDRLPILSQADFERAGVPDEGANLDGPSVIRLPSWLPRARRADRRARYYLYFADHDGAYLRMAWAARIQGPWTLYRVGPDIPAGGRGVLDLGDERRLPADERLAASDHVASPHVEIDDAGRRFLLYFHSPASVDGGFGTVQHTFVATSPDGLLFDSPELRRRGEGLRPVVLADAYLRPFRYLGGLLGIANRGSLYQAPDPTRPWLRTGPAPDHDNWALLANRDHNPLMDDIRAAGLARAGIEVRHAAARLVGPRLDLFYTRVGDSPERILYSAIDTSQGSPGSWDASYPPVELLRPEEPWDGVHDPQLRSRIGRAPENAKELRDPSPFRDRDGRWYLLYSGRGEDAIGLARLQYPPPFTFAVELLDGRRVDGFELLEHRWIRLTLRGEPGFDVAEVDPASLVLGPGGSRAERIRVRDADGDGQPDLVMRFRARDLGLAIGSESLCLKGALQSSTPFEGCDRIDRWRLHRGRGEGDSHSGHGRKGHGAEQRRHQREGRHR